MPSKHTIDTRRMIPVTPDNFAWLEREKQYLTVSRGGIKTTWDDVVTDIRQRLSESKK